MEIFSTSRAKLGQILKVLKSGEHFGHYLIFVLSFLWVILSSFMRNTNEVFFLSQTHPEMTLIYIIQELENYLGLILIEDDMD